MYEFLYVVGIVFWVALAAYLLVRRIRWVRALRAQRLEMSKPAETTRPRPEPHIVRISAPVQITIPTKARSIWVLRRSGYDGDFVEAVSWDVGKLKARQPNVKWVEDSDGWYEPKARMTDKQWVIEPLDFIQ